MVHPHTKVAADVAVSLIGKNFRFAVFRSIESAGAEWDAAAPVHNLFLQRRYLTVMEHQPPLGMRFSYIVFYQGDDPIGVCLCQIKHFSAENNIKSEQTEEKDPCFFTALGKWLRKQVASRVAGDILIIGNMLLSGEHAFYFKPNTISTSDSMALLENAANAVIAMFEREGTKMPVILIKDLPADNKTQATALAQKSFVEFDIQPCMTLDLPFKDFDAYLEAMSTKYRTRAKRAFKKAQDLEKRELGLLEIQRELPRLYQLYREIARNAGFNMVDLNDEYLLALKRDLGDCFQLYAYYYQDELVAFYTTIYNNGELEAHFLGYEKDRNHDFQIYQIDRFKEYLISVLKK